MNHGGHHPSTARRRLSVVLVMTGVVMGAEVGGAWISGSLALLADAGHMLTDFLALVVAFAAVTLGARPAGHRHTYGYRRLEILAAMANGVALVLVSGSILVEGIRRWLHPAVVDPYPMGIVALVGLAANGVGLWVLGRDRHDLNLRAAFLHVLGDTLGSVGVVVASVVIAFTGWDRADALVSMLIAVAIVVTSIALLRDVLDVLLESAPKGLDPLAVRHSIGTVSGVEEVHDLHVWSISTGLLALSAHVIVADQIVDTSEVLVSIRRVLQERFDIRHSTLQIEAHSFSRCECRTQECPS